MMGAEPDGLDILLTAWAEQVRLSPEEANTVYMAVLQAVARDATNVETTSETAGLAVAILARQLAIDVARQAVRRARTPLWGGSWVPPPTELRAG